MRGLVRVGGTKEWRESKMEMEVERVSKIKRRWRIAGIE